MPKWPHKFQTISCMHKCIESYYWSVLSVNFDTLLAPLYSILPALLPVHSTKIHHILKVAWKHYKATIKQSFTKGRDAQHFTHQIFHVLFMINLSFNIWFFLISVFFDIHINSLVKTTPIVYNAWLNHNNCSIHNHTYINPV